MQGKSAALLWDVKNACALILDFVDSVPYASYVDNALLQSAVERQLEIAGEALNSLRKSDPATAARVPDFRRVIGLRNILIHGYAVVDHAVVYAAATERVPELLTAVTALLEDEDGVPSERPEAE